MNEDPPVIVFDFDLTLTAWDTAARFFRWLLMRDLWRLGLVIASAPVLGPLMLVRSTRRWPIRYAVWVATLGRSLEDLHRLVKQQAQMVFSGPESLFYRDGLVRLQDHLDRGHRVVIATGSLELLAKEHLLLAGYGHVPVVGSSLRPFLGGLARDCHCVGANKIPMLTQRGFSPPWVVGYGDHELDLPVLSLCRESYLVNAKAHVVLRAEQVLVNRAKVLAWQ